MTMIDTHDPAGVTQAMELGRQTQLLGELLRRATADIVEVAVGDIEHREMVLEQFPAAGSRRLVAYRSGTGNDSFPIPTTGAVVLNHNVGRLGGTIVNSGTNPVILYLCQAGKAQAGAPAIFLAASGGSWDFRLGNLLWCGSVSAVAQVAASTLTIAEV